MLSSKEQQRYSRNLPIIGVAGQIRLKQAKVLCVGSGGLGCAALPYLVACGVGVIGIIDADAVDLSNLQRQVLFTENDIGKNKTKCAQQRLQQLNADCKIITYSEQLTHSNHQLIQSYDVLLDGCDNAATRYLLNHHCRRLQKPLVYAAITGCSAQISVFNYQNGPCYECLYPYHTDNTHDASCANRGVLGVLPGVAGSLQASEVIKIITQQGAPLSGQLLTMNLWDLQFKHYTLPKRPDCTAAQCGQSQSSTPSTAINQITASQLTHIDSLVLIDVRQPHEHAQGHITGSRLVPLDQLTNQLESLSKQDCIVCYCQTGKRSLTAVKLLLQNGFAANKLYNLSGGFEAYKLEPQIIDRTN